MCDQLFSDVSRGLVLSFCIIIAVIICACVLGAYKDHREAKARAKYLADARAIANAAVARNL